jgi:hypothetical protein
MRFEAPLCRIHWLQAQSLKFIAWLSLVGYAVGIAALVRARSMWQFEGYPLYWSFAMAAMALIPTLFLWAKKARGPVPARVALEAGGTRVVLTYPDGVPVRK